MRFNYREGIRVNTIGSLVLYTIMRDPLGFWRSDFKL